jgi:hypothetical protein
VYHGLLCNGETRTHTRGNKNKIKAINDLFLELFRKEKEIKFLEKKQLGIC